MKHKLKINFIIILICFLSFLGGYSKVIYLPSYAASIPEGYTQVTDKDKLSDAFLAYCRSRDSEITSSVLGASATYAYKVITDASNTLGIDINQLQSELYYLNENSGLKWYMSASGIQFFNSIFGYLIQNEGLEVGQPADKLLYSGYTFTDKSGNSCLCYIADRTGSITKQNISAYGTPYKLTPSGLNDLYNNTPDTKYFYYDTDNPDATRRRRLSVEPSLTYLYYNTGNNTFNDSLKIFNRKTSQGYGYFSACIYQNSLYALFIGGGNNLPENSENLTYSPLFRIVINDENPSTQTNINFISNNIKIEYEGDTYINNDGTPDSGGGGQDPDQGDDWDPSVPIIPPAGGGTGNNNTINWPDIDIPDFNLPDFSIGDITDKFPFSIPFDLVALLTVLDGEPIAPHIEGTIPLGDFYTWNLDFDFSQFDNYARIFRAFEFIGFCIGLIYFTVRLVKG